MHLSKFSKRFISTAALMFSFMTLISTNLNFAPSDSDEISELNLREELISTGSFVAALYTKEHLQQQIKNGS